MTFWMRIAILLVLAAVASPALAQPAGDAKPPATDDAARERAKAHFDRGNDLLQQRKFELALGAFTQSLEEFPTRAATENGAVCLRELGRPDEALIMFQKVLAFPDVPEDVRKRIEPQIAELAAATGVVNVTGGAEGAVVSIDGRPRGTLPLKEPLRAAPGLRTVRVHLEGYVPFVQTVDVRAGGKASVEAKLEVLARAGRLRVKEASGAEATVLIDGVVVGDTPWEGALAPGDHAVWLRAPSDRGTAPKKATVLLGQRAELSLDLVTLHADLIIKATPPGATVALEGVPVGTTPWEGRLPEGRYTVVVSAPGYLTATRDLRLGPEAHETLKLDLSPVAPPKVEEPPKKPRFEIGANGAFAVAPLFYGPTCADPCSSGVGLGMHLEAIAAYRFSSGFGIGGGAGFVRLQQTIEDRRYGLAPPGKPDQPASANDSVILSGATVLAHGSMRLGERFFGVFDAGAGGFFGAAQDERTLASRADAGDTYEIGPYFASGGVAGVAASGGIRAGIEAVPGLEIWVGAAALFLVPLSEPEWTYTGPVPAGTDGAAALRQEPILNDVIVAVTPSLGLGGAFE
ncbi:MAG: PEGA domain-containing protein [Polyangiaceae bacterium]|nr:PEGA domain-containing protein [Polyangiaceae bacterium]